MLSFFAGPWLCGEDSREEGVNEHWKKALISFVSRQTDEQIKRDRLDRERITAQHTNGFHLFLVLFVLISVVIDGVVHPLLLQDNKQTHPCTQ